MGRISFLVCTLLLLFSCQSDDKTNYGERLAVPPQTLESFADSMVRLDKFSLESIDAAASYFQRLVPADTTLADSAAVMFLRHVGTVVDTINQKIFRDEIDYSSLLYNPDSATETHKQFQQYLLTHHVLLQGDGEGGVYAVADYQWASKLLQPKTSAAVDNYLSLLAKEEKDPTLLDAGLVIETKELVNRLVTSEALLKEKLPNGFSKDNAQKNRFYTATLLFGSDNSPAVDFNSISLVEEFRDGYEYLLTNYSASAAAQMVKEWQAIVKAKDIRKIDEWRTKYNPYE